MTSGSSKVQKWHGKSTLFCATFKSDKEFTVPAVYVPQPLAKTLHTLNKPHSVCVPFTKLRIY